jgi:hypothetical protein
MMPPVKPLASTRIPLRTTSMRPRCNNGTMIPADGPGIQPSNACTASNIVTSTTTSNCAAVAANTSVNNFAASFSVKGRPCCTTSWNAWNTTIAHKDNAAEWYKNKYPFSTNLCSGVFLADAILLQRIWHSGTGDV